MQHTLARTRFPTVEERSSLAVLLGVPQRKINVWFQNQRQREPSTRSLEVATASVIIAADQPGMSADSIMRKAVEWSQDGMRYQIGKYLFRQIHRLTIEDTRLDQEDAETIAIYALLVKVAEIVAV